MCFMGVVMAECCLVPSKTDIYCSDAPELSNNIIQKGRAFGRSGSVVESGRSGRFGILPAGIRPRFWLRWCGGVCRPGPKEDLNVKALKETTLEARLEGRR